MQNWMLVEQLGDQCRQDRRAAAAHYRLARLARRRPAGAQDPPSVAAFPRGAADPAITEVMPAGGGRRASEERAGRAGSAEPPAAAGRHYPALA